MPRIKSHFMKRIGARLNVGDKVSQYKIPIFFIPGSGGAKSKIIKTKFNHKVDKVSKQ